MLGTTFPAEALIAVSGQDETVVRAALAELVRREVLSVSADPLSPERGSYGFAQHMLRQVAYDTLSRRDRKMRHLKVAAHLRQAFPGDGEEVADVIARHYLDALDAIPGDPEATQIRGQAIAALVRAARRAERTGAPALAATSYATAAELSMADRQQAVDGQPTSATCGNTQPRPLAEAPTGLQVSSTRAVPATTAWTAVELARRPARGPSPADALRGWGHYAEAREQLIAALDILRAEPDTDTVRALDSLANARGVRRLADADTLTTEALILGQALNVGVGQLSSLFITRGIYLIFAGRWPESVAYLRESARLATQAGDNSRLGRALLNLSVSLWITDAAAAAETARTAAGHLRLIGARSSLASAIFNLVAYLLWLGDWDAAGTELAQAMDSGGLAGIDLLACERAWLAALRGDAATAETMLAAADRSAGQRRAPGQGMDQPRGSLHRRRPPPARERLEPCPRGPGSRGRLGDDQR